jgi:hypothetical protein
MRTVKATVILAFLLLSPLAAEAEFYRYDDGAVGDAVLGEFVLDGRTWPNPGNIDYSFVNFTADIGQEEVETAISNALVLWASACPDLVFSQIADNGAAYNDASATPPNAGDIRIQFGAGSHGDPFPFDGTGGTLAHAFYPPPNGFTAAGDTHFDEDESWSLTGAPGGGQPIDLTTVAAHEFGHALGLRHEPDTAIDAIMNPFYTGPRVLGQDDIDAIRTLYCPTQTGTLLPIDLVLLLDLTGSMDDDLPQIQASIPVVLQSIVNTLPNVRLGLATFRDFPFNPFGDPGPTEATTVPNRSMRHSTRPSPVRAAFSGSPGALGTLHHRTSDSRPAVCR